MSSMSKVAGLSKYITTLPKAKFSLTTITILSVLTGILIFVIEPLNTSLINKIIYGAISGFIIFGISSFIAGILNYNIVKKFNGLNMKQKHSLFLSLTSLAVIFLITIIFIIFSFISSDLIINSIYFSCVIVFGWNFLVILGTSNMNSIKSSLVALIQPLLIILLLTITGQILNIHFIMQIGVLGSLIKFLIGSLIIFIFLYLFIDIIRSPMQNNLGYDGLKLLSYFIAHMNEGISYLEELFDSVGEEIDTVIGIISFKDKNDNTKALFVSPSVHPGPIGDVGGANMPTIIANKYEHFTMVVHGPSTHDFNPVSVNEIDKIVKSVDEGLEEMEYSNKASKFTRYTYEKANIGVQFFKNGMMMLSTFAPSGSDDIEFSTGLAMMIKSQMQCNIENSIIVDCHNSFNVEKGGVLPGNPEVFQILNAIDKIENTTEKYPLKVGISTNSMPELDKTNGVGDSGLKVMVIEVENQRTAVALFDSNNMELGFRETIMNSLSDLPIDELEVLTTDTHTVNTLSRGYNPIGISEKEKIIEYLRYSINEAINDLEPVKAGTNLKKIKGLKAFGANNSVELVSTISSITIVGKKLFPVIIITTLIFEIIWIFLL